MLLTVCHRSPFYGDLQAGKTCLDAFIKAAVYALNLNGNSAVLHTVVVATNAADHAAKLDKFLAPHTPGVQIVACNSTFDDTYPALCQRVIYVVKNDAAKLRRLCRAIHAYTSKPGSTPVHILQLDEADNMQGGSETVQYFQCNETLQGRPTGSWDPPQLPHPLTFLTTATHPPCFLECHSRVSFWVFATTCFLHFSSVHAYNWDLT